MRFSKLTATLSIMAVACVALCGSGFAQNENFTFPMVPTLGSEECVPATGRVTITHTFGLVENMHVEVSGLPKNTDFDLFVIQKPTPNFGLAWYMGDMLTDAHGVAVNDFIGRFNIGTFIVAPGSEPAPVVLPGDASSNPATAPCSFIISVFGSTLQRLRMLPDVAARSRRSTQRTTPAFRF